MGRQARNPNHRRLSTVLDTENRFRTGPFDIKRSPEVNLARIIQPAWNIIAVPFSPPRFRSRWLRARIQDHRSCWGSHRCQDDPGGGPLMIGLVCFLHLLTSQEDRTLSVPSVTELAYCAYLRLYCFISYGADRIELRS